MDEGTYVTTVPCAKILNSASRTEGRVGMGERRGETVYCSHIRFTIQGGAIMEPFEAFQMNGYLLILHTDEVSDFIDLPYNLKGARPELRKFSNGSINGRRLGYYGSVNKDPVSGFKGTTIFGRRARGDRALFGNSTMERPRSII